MRWLILRTSRFHLFRNLACLSTLFFGLLLLAGCGRAKRTVDLAYQQRALHVANAIEPATLDPHINIWEVARPIVENYIKENLGPKAVLRDLFKTARVLARFGPKLPALVEAQLIRAGNSATPAGRPGRQYGKVLGVLILAACFGAGFLLRGLI